MKKLMIMIIAGFMFITIFTIFLPVETCIASGNTIYVDDGYDENTPGWEETHFDNIQDAISKACTSESIDTVYVYGGTYNQNIEINTALTLTGEDKDTTIINGVADNKDTVTVESVSNVNISGFEIIQNPTAQGNEYHGIYINHGDYCSVTDCNVKDGNIGIWVKNSDGCTISGNTIEGNDFAGVSISIYSDNNIVFDNTFSQNEKGIYIITDSNSNVLHHNTFQNNDQHAYDECNNQWDDGSEGNYWDDYGGYDNNSNNIGDTPYNIPGGSNQDRYPLGFFTGENQKPTADAGGPYTATPDEEITFDGSGSSDPEETELDYRWDFDDDGEYDTEWSTDPTATYSYAEGGTYTVTLQVKDAGGLTDTDTAQVTITVEGKKPTATIVKPNIASAIYGETVDFHGYGLPSEGMITEFNWRSSKDGVLSSLATFTKSDLSVGTHAIYFKVKDVNGWSNEVSVDLVINPDQSSPNEPPVADAGGPYSGYVNVSLSFDASGSYDPDEEDINYSWDFSDGTTGTNESSTHTYTSVGNYTITLTVTDNEGATSSDTTYANITIQASDQNGNGEEDDGFPGFELIFVIIASVIVLFWIKKRKGS